MDAVPIDHRFPVGVVGYVFIEASTRIRRCVFDSSQTVTERFRDDARNLVRATGGECSTCTVTCPFNLN